MFAINRCAMVVCGVAAWLTAASVWGQKSDQPAASRPATKALRVLLITGQGDHDWRATAPFLRRILAETARFEVRVCESPVGLSAKTFADFDVVVDDCGGPTLGAETQKAILDFVAGGKGLVMTHAALGSIKSDWPELARFVNASKSGNSKAAATEFVEVKLEKPDHSIVKGMTGPFKLADSLYHGLTVAADADVIARSGDDAVLFTFPFGKGRVFCTAMGSDLAALQTPEFITTFARGIQWAAGGDVKLPPNLALPQPDANAVRTLLITGGHDHEATFYSIFDGFKDLTWTPVSTSAMAFQKDFRTKYDVLILYDFSRDLDERSKANLSDFVGSGKGVVVLHHALLNYQAWPWWYQTVVGGSYRLAPEGNIPSSTVKDAQRMFITPQKHPITAGIAPFRLTDETYKRMWIAPDVQPLLTTDNPNSDATIAWVSPFAKSRVVYIQLGHGRGSYFHPSFRTLVHNAILWTAGRLKEPETKLKEDSK
jgi:type 1 glutamine amidotransferase